MTDIKLKPGKWVQRNGGIATVAAITAPQQCGHTAIGVCADNTVQAWHPNGRCSSHSECGADLIRECREQRDYWLLMNGCWVPSEEAAERFGGIYKRVREVLP